MNLKRRIEWVDVVKGMAVPLIIIGHTSQSAAFITYIYSFHMPLFFLLSGYTSKRAEDVKTYGKHILKNFCYLILPCILVQLGIEWVELWMKTGTWQMLTWTKITGIFYRLFWGCAWGWADGFPSVGMLWFFITMFWAKVIWEGIGLLFPEKDTAICIFVALIGIWYGPGNYLPQNLDIAMMTVLYYCIGNFARKYQEKVIAARFKMPLFWIALMIWVFCAQQGMYIELAVKSYPGIVVGILESICGSYVFCILAQEVAENRICKKIFSFLGRHTLLIVLVHHMDSLMEEFWLQDSWGMSCVYRGLLVIGISTVVSGARYLVKNLFLKLRTRKNVEVS